MRGDFVFDARDDAFKEFHEIVDLELLLGFCNDSLDVGALDEEERAWFFCVNEARLP